MQRSNYVVIEKDINQLKKQYEGSERLDTDNLKEIQLRLKIR